jgi:hypothetical protein
MNKERESDGGHTADAGRLQNRDAEVSDYASAKMKMKCFPHAAAPHTWSGTRRVSKTEDKFICS